MRATQEAGTVHHIGESLQAWFQEILIFPGIILQVGILNDDVFSVCLRDPAVNGCAFTQIDRLV